MRVLIDECMPWKIGRSLAGHDCCGVSKAGFAGKKNGILLSIAEEHGYDVLLTVDQGIPYQQRLEGRKIAVVITAVSNKLETLSPYIPAVLDALHSIQPGQVAHVG